MYVKLLKAGRLRIPEYDLDTISYPMEWHDFMMMLEGFTEDSFHHARAKEVYVLQESHACGKNISRNYDINTTFTHTPRLLRCTTSTKHLRKSSHSSCHTDGKNTTQRQS